MKKEIEHKVLILVGRAMMIVEENEGDYERVEMFQGYIISEDSIEVRIRMKVDPEGSVPFRYFLTAKSGGGLTRDEKEIEISKELFDSLDNLFFGEDVELIFKEHYDFHIEDRAGVLELNIVDYDGFAYMEVEFKTEEEAKEFEENFDSIFNDVNAELITEDQNYKMKNYWNRTRGKTAISSEELHFLIATMKSLGFEDEWLQMIWSGRN